MANWKKPGSNTSLGSVPCQLRACPYEHCQRFSNAEELAAGLSPAPALTQQRNSAAELSRRFLLPKPPCVLLIKIIQRVVLSTHKLAGSAIRMSTSWSSCTSPQNASPSEIVIHCMCTCTTRILHWVNGQSPESIFSIREIPILAG